MIEDGAVLIRDGRIVSVGPSRRLENLGEARHAELLDASGQVVMPGLVDGQCYLVFGPIRPAPSRPPLEAGPEPPSALSLSMSRRRLELQMRRRIHHLTRHGTTSVELKSGFALDESGELRLLRVLAALRGDPLDVIPAFVIGAVWPRQPALYLDLLTSRLLPVLHQRRLARFVEVYCGPGHLSLGQARRCLIRAAELGLGRKVLAAASFQAVSMAVELGATSVAGLSALGPEEIRLLAASPVIVTLLPAVALSYSPGSTPPARDLIAAGAAVALASGYGAVSSTYSMQAVLSLACSHLELTPAEAIAAATINAACSLGLGSQLGSLEPGKQADLVIFDAPDYREIPYHFGVNLVDSVLKRGKLIYRRGEILWGDD